MDSAWRRSGAEPSMSWLAATSRVAPREAQQVPFCGQRGLASIRAQAVPWARGNATGRLRTKGEFPHRGENEAIRPRSNFSLSPHFGRLTIRLL
jgi:hypothetical protein